MLTTEYNVAHAGRKSVRTAMRNYFTWPYRVYGVVGI